jgi:MYXO-CTERM domain-containing protein
MKKKGGCQIAAPGSAGLGGAWLLPTAGALLVRRRKKR